MYFRFDRKFNVLKIDDGFARLLRVGASGDLAFEFNYKISQLEAVKRNSLKVNVTVLSKIVPRKPFIPISNGGFNATSTLVRSILTQVIDAKTIVKEQQTHTVAFRSSDISAKINNEILGQLQASPSAQNIQALYSTVLNPVTVGELKNSNQVQPILQYIAHSNLPVSNLETSTSASIDLDSRSVMYEMILRQGLDPSHITNMSHRSVAAIDSLGGLLRPSKVSEQNTDPAVQLLNWYILGEQADPFRTITTQIQDEAVVQVAQSVPQDELEISVPMIIPRFARFQEGATNSQFLVKFDLIDSQTQATIDTIVKPLDVSRHLQLFYTPRKAPLVKTAPSEVSSRVNLEIKQRDQHATRVQVFKKILTRSSTEVEDYVLVGTFPLLSRQASLLVPVEKPVNSAAIYRIVPIGQTGNQGFDYTNVVVRPARYSPLKAVAINAKSTESGIEVEVRQFPPSAVSIEILVRNLTTHETSYRSVGVVNLIDDATRVANYLSVLDTSVAVGRIYEYTARIIYESGTSELSGSAIVDFIKLVPGKVDLRISDLEVTSDNEPNVTFTMNSIVLDENLDVILSLLKRQDIKEYFNNDIAREREFLKSLIAHNVQRVDLTSGIREDFGVVVDEFFDDRALQKNNAVSPLKYGKKYRYEIATLLRAPETMFEMFVKDRVDELTGKSYSFKPSKFLHPLVLTRGIIVTAQGLRTRYSQAAMSHGLVGTLETVEVSLDEQPARIVSPSTARFDKSLNVLTWKVEGSIDQIDHFIITKDVHGVRTLIGKAHSEFEFGNCQYLHAVGPRDRGELKYIITPVFNDYRTGISSITNSVII